LESACLLEQESALAWEKERASLLAKLSVSAWVSGLALVLELALEKERASLLAKLSASALVSAKEPVSRSDSASE
jgi:hypothetical protein